MASGGPLVPSWGSLGASWVPLASFLVHAGGPQVLKTPFGDSQKASQKCVSGALVPSWGPLVPSWGSLGASWAPLVSFLVLSWALLVAKVAARKGPCSVGRERK